MKRQWIFGALIVLSLMLFESANFATTEYSLTDIFGNLSFLGLKWSTILALAAFGVDFAGLGILFGKDNGVKDAEWLILGAWFLAATANAMATYWTVSLVLVNYQGVGSQIFGREFLLDYVPMIVVVSVWLIRILLVGTFVIVGERLFPRSLHKESLEEEQGRLLKELSKDAPALAFQLRQEISQSKSKNTNQFREPKTGSERLVPESGPLPRVVDRHHPPQRARFSPLQTALALVRNGSKR